MNIFCFVAMGHCLVVKREEFTFLHADLTFLTVAHCVRRIRTKVAHNTRDALLKPRFQTSIILAEDIFPKVD